MDDQPLLSLGLSALRGDGFLLLPGVLAPSQVAQLQAAISSLVPRHWDYNGLLEHYKCVFNRDPLWLPGTTWVGQSSASISSR